MRRKLGIGDNTATAPKSIIAARHAGGVGPCQPIRRQAICTADVLCRQSCVQSDLAGTGQLCPSSNHFASGYGVVLHMALEH